MIVASCSADRLSGVAREFLRLQGDPDENMGVEKDHSRFQSDNGAEVSTFPTILAFPTIKPKMSSPAISAGTSFTTGLPCLVIMTGSPLSETWSMTARHWDLNWAAGIFCMQPPRIVVILI